MSDEAKAIQAQRQAFVEGCRWTRAYYDRPLPERAEDRTALFMSWARDAFPITRKVPRVVRVKRGVVEFYARAGGSPCGVSFYRDRACLESFSVLGVWPHEPAIYADLLANPYETVTE